MTSTTRSCTGRVRRTLPNSFNEEEIVEATKEDEELQQLVKMVRGEERTAERSLVESVKARFGRVLAEISVTEKGLVLRGTRLVLPTDTDAQVEDLLKGCLACQLEDGYNAVAGESVDGLGHGLLRSDTEWTLPHGGCGRVFQDAGG